MKDIPIIRILELVGIGVDPKNPKTPQKWCHFEDPKTPLGRDPRIFLAKLLGPQTLKVEHLLGAVYMGKPPTKFKGAGCSGTLGTIQTPRFAGCATYLKSGQFIINPYPNLRPFWGGFPYFSPPFGVTTSREQVVINCPAKSEIRKKYPLGCCGSPRFSRMPHQPRKLNDLESSGHLKIGFPGYPHIVVFSRVLRPNPSTRTTFGSIWAVRTHAGRKQQWPSHAAVTKQQVRDERGSGPQPPELFANTFLTSAVRAADVPTFSKIGLAVSRIQSTFNSTATPLLKIASIDKLAVATTWVFPKIMVPPNHPF